MKKLFLFLSILFSLQITAQNCDYSIPRYGFRSEKNIYVGTDLDYNLQAKDLLLDIYYPIGSAEIKRPMVILAFGGGFFQGTRQDIADACIEFAKRGFVAVTIDYRIGFHGIDNNFKPPFTYDQAEIKRAGYRGMQDAKAMLRFMKARHTQDSTDLDRIWMGGFSAGSFVAMGSVFVDKESDKPNETGAISPVGNIARPDLGPYDGNLIKNNYDTKVQGVFNFFGGLLDTNQIEKNDNIALLSYHQIGDPVVACDAKTPYWPYPIIPTNYPIAYGSCVIKQRLMNINYPANLYKTLIYQGNAHEIHNLPVVFQFMFENANPLLCKSLTNVDATKTITKIAIQTNPVFDNLELMNAEKNTSYQIININGMTCTKGIIQGRNISVKELQAGYYILHINGQKLKFIKA